MANKRDLTGKKFGKLTVMEPTKEREDRYVIWRCRCDCGNEVLVSSRDLKRGSARNCGCEEKPYPNRKGPVAEDITGQRFGKLVALSRADNLGRHTCWLCRCDCGNTRKVRTSSLKAGLVTSCGCDRLEPSHKEKKNLAGKRFGRLVAKYATKERDYKGSVYWHCVCDCGNELDVTEDSLVHGGYVSCGCRRKEINDSIRENLHFVDGTCVEWLRSRKHRSDNSSGYQGVMQRKDGKYMAYIGFKGQRYYLGVHHDMEDAVRVRQDAESFLHEGFLEAYEKWQKQADQSEEWAAAHPLLFEVRKGDGSLDILTSDGERSFVFA